MVYFEHRLPFCVNNKNLNIFFIYNISNGYLYTPVLSQEPVNQLLFLFELFIFPDNFCIGKGFAHC